MSRKVEKSDEEWKARLSESQYNVLRKGYTEPKFSGRYWKEKRSGLYRCAGCHAALFNSSEKYDSGTGWPSFLAPHPEAPIETAEDRTHGMVRTEVRCAECGGHLGHLFTDGPAPTGMRYCINSTSLYFESDEPKTP